MEDRRTFLKGLVAAAAGAGLVTNLSGKRISPYHYVNYPQLWKQVSEQIKKTGRNCLVITIPNDHSYRNKLARMVNSENALMQQVLATSNLICMPVHECKNNIKNFKIENNLTLLDSEAKLIDGKKMDFFNCTTNKKFGEEVLSFVQGKDNKHLKAQAEKVYKSGKAKKEDVEKNLKKLDAEGFRDRRKARRYFQALGLSSLPFLLAAAKEKGNSVEVKETLKELFKEQIEKANLDAKGIQENRVNYYDHAIKCGMACMFPHSKTFLDTYIS